MVDQLQADTVRRGVRDRYAEIAAKGSSCCGPEASPTDVTGLGYSSEDVESMPAEANLGLGCGNPVALAALRPGEVVLDLGSGGGFDCFLAARRVGPEGQVIGVDMTPEMLSSARESAARNHFDNVEFRLGEIEHLPVADDSVDVVISNCVINLSPDKAGVFREAYRVLRPGGRLSVSDLVAVSPLPPEVRNDPDLYASCVGGAATVEDHTGWLTEAGFEEVQVRPRHEGVEVSRHDETPVASFTIEGIKPRR